MNRKEIVLYKGDDTGAFGLRDIRIRLVGMEGVVGPAANATAQFRLLDFVRDFSAEELSSGELALSFSRSQIAAWPAGRFFASLTLFDHSAPGDAKEFVLSSRIPFLVSVGAKETVDCGNVVVEAQYATIVVEFKIGYDALSGKPKINGMVVEGDRMPSDYGLATGSALAEEELRAKKVESGLASGKRDKTDLVVYDGQGIPTGQTIATSADLVSAVSPKRDKSDFDIRDAQGAVVDRIAKVSDMAQLTMLVPPQASAQNQLADKDFVNSSVATNTATFRGSYNLVSDLGLTVADKDDHEKIGEAIAARLAAGDSPVIPDNNDYGFVQIPRSDAAPSEIERIDRYKYTIAEEIGSWDYEFSLNNSSFTSAQWAAIISGITRDKVAKLDGIEPGAQVNVVETVKVNGAALPVENKAVNIDVPDVSAKRDYKDLTYDVVHSTTGNFGVEVWIYDGDDEFRWDGANNRWLSTKASPSDNAQVTGSYANGNWHFVFSYAGTLMGEWDGFYGSLSIAGVIHTFVPKAADHLALESSVPYVCGPETVINFEPGNLARTVSVRPNRGTRIKMTQDAGVGDSSCRLKVEIAGDEACFSVVNATSNGNYSVYAVDALGTPVIVHIAGAYADGYSHITANTLWPNPFGIGIGSVYLCKGRRMYGKMILDVEVADMAIF